MQRLPENLDRDFVLNGGVDSAIKHLKMSVPTHDSDSLIGPMKRAEVYSVIHSLESLKNPKSAVSQSFAANDALIEARASGTRSQRQKAAIEAQEAGSKALAQWVGCLEAYNGLKALEQPSRASQPASIEVSLH